MGEEKNGKSGPGCFGGGVIIAAIVFAFAAIIAFPIGGLVTVSAIALESVATSKNFDVVEEDDFPELVWERGGEKDSPTVIRFRLEDEIAFGSGGSDILGNSEPTAAERLLATIRYARRDSEVRGLLLELDTPGGEVTAADVIANEIREFRYSDTNRFVVVHMGSMCCSGGYYIAAAANAIVAHPTTVTGSIGVIMSTFNAAKLAEKIGVESVAIATGGNKNMLDPLKPVEPEHLEIFRKVVASDYERFVAVVALGRSMEVDKVRAIADGRVFSAFEAKELGLVDTIGYRDDVDGVIEELAGEEARICRYEEQTSWRSILAEAFSATGAVKPLKAAVSAAAKPRLEYRLR